MLSREYLDSIMNNSLRKVLLEQADLAFFKERRDKTIDNYLALRQKHANTSGPICTEEEFCKELENVANLVSHTTGFAIENIRADYGRIAPNLLQFDYDQVMGFFFLSTLTGGATFFEFSNNGTVYTGAGLAGFFLSVYGISQYYSPTKGNDLRVITSDTYNSREVKLEIAEQPRESLIGGLAEEIAHYLQHAKIGLRGYPFAAFNEGHAIGLASRTSKIYSNNENNTGFMYKVTHDNAILASAAYEWLLSGGEKTDGFTRIPKTNRAIEERPWEEMIHYVVGTSVFSLLEQKYKPENRTQLYADALRGKVDFTKLA